MGGAWMVAMWLGCKGAPAEDSAATTTPPGLIDQDGDGFVGRDDCDDADPEVYPYAEERCDGVDNNCDGEVDALASDAREWFADVDGDGWGSAITELGCGGEGWVAQTGDCDDSDASVYPGAVEGWYDGVDSDCDGALEPSLCDGAPEGQALAINRSCLVEPSDPAGWSLVVEWRSDDITYAVAPGARSVWSTPVVAQLTDDDGDGLITAQDVPDIVFNSHELNVRGSGFLRVISGDGAGEHFSVESARTDRGDAFDLAASTGVAVGDLEGDGLPDIVTVTFGHVVALEHDGRTKWISDDYDLPRDTVPAIADMDGDGLAEVIAGAIILSSEGALLGVAAADGYRQAFAADLDGDGVMEHIGGSAVSRMDGSLVWEHQDIRPGASAVLDWDGDGYGEVASNRDGELTIFDTDGAVLLSLASRGSAAPCVGDFDGDGRPEVAVASGGPGLQVYDAGGVGLWELSGVYPVSGDLGCAAFDLNGDGVDELVYMKGGQVVILDGPTGAELAAVRAEIDIFNEGFVQPIVVDVDADGDAELIFGFEVQTYAEDPGGVLIVGEANDGWVGARGLWNQAAYWGGNINDDQSIPAAPDMPWDLGHGFRAQQGISPHPRATQDYSAHILGTCEDCEAGTVEVFVALDNTGLQRGPAGVPVALYAEDEDGRRLLGVQRSPTAIAPGERLDALSFTVSLDELGAAGLTAIADDAGGEAHTPSRECDEDNNADTWTSPICP